MRKRWGKSPRLAATRHAVSMYEKLKIESEHGRPFDLILWTDASSSSLPLRQNLPSGGAVVFKDNHPTTGAPAWNNVAFGIAGFISVVDAEMIAIQQALRIALVRCRREVGRTSLLRENPPRRRVHLCTDCYAALVRISESKWDGVPEIIGSSRRRSRDWGIAYSFTGSQDHRSSP